MRYALTALFMVIASSAHAESNYCIVDFRYENILTALEITKAAEERFRVQCKPGDVVVLPVEFVRAIGSYCDFTQSIVRNEKNVLCVMTAERPMRALIK